MDWSLSQQTLYQRQNLSLHKADRLSVTTTAVTAWSEMLTHSWHTMVVNHLYPPEAPMTFLPKYLLFATSLMNQDAERISDRIRHLEEKEKAAKKLQREAAKEHKKNEKIRKARQQLRNPADFTEYLIACISGRHGKGLTKTRTRNDAKSAAN